jgi:hypothetical protein
VLPDPPAFERLAEITTPSTLLIGDRDHPMVVECANAIAARIRGCRALTVPDADHLLPLRVPEVVAEHIGTGCGRTGDARTRRMTGQIFPAPAPAGTIEGRLAGSSNEYE